MQTPPIWFALLLTSSTVASAQVGTQPEVEEALGTVSQVESRWLPGGDLVSEVFVEGHSEPFVFFGGTQDGIGVHYSHVPAPPRMGSQTQIAFRRTSEGTEVVWAQTVEAESADAIQSSSPTLASASGISVERTRASQIPLWRQDRCVHLVINSAGTEQLTDGAEFLALTQGADRWSAATESCGEVALSWELRAGASIGRDGISTVHFRDTEWCRPETATSPKLCYAPEAAAVTRLVFVDDPSRWDDGKILEADIEFNSALFSFAANDPEKPFVDLESVAAHEFGHLLGLAHTCWMGNGLQPVDLSGNPLPACSDLDPTSEAARATMFVDVEPGSTERRTLEALDVAAACSLTEGLECSRQNVVEGGCSAGRSTGVSWLWVLPLWGLLRRRKNGDESTNWRDMVGCPGFRR